MRFHSGLAAIVAAIACPAAAETPAAPADKLSFCARLAPQMQMELVSEPRSHVPPSWQVDTVTLGMLLLPIGGSNVSMGLRPVDTGNAAEWARLAPACDTAKRGILCKLEGPLRFHVTTKRYDAVVVAASGERAEVKLRNTIIECRDLPPAPNPQHTPN